MEIWEKLSELRIKDEEKYARVFAETVKFAQHKLLEFKEKVEDKGDYYLVFEKDRANSNFIHVVPKEAWELFREMQIKAPKEFLGFSVLVGRREKPLRVSCFGIPCGLLGRKLIER